MAHHITFRDFQRFTLLTTLQVKDIIEMFYRGGDVNFVVGAGDLKGNTMGNSSYDAISRTHIVNLCQKNIEYFFNLNGQCGGNFPVNDVRLSAASVLVHELQHCNQNLLHRGNNIFWGKLGGLDKAGKPRMKRYRGRACEREARDFADEKLNELCAYFDLPPLRRRAENRTEDSSELDDVIDLLAEIDSPTMDDIKDELRASGLLRPSNVLIVKKELAHLGVYSEVRSVVG